jgi:hypothetical protein
MSEIEVIILQLEQAFQRRSWHGPNLMGSIRGLKAADAAWRPAPGQHNIWELIVHAAYWKYAVYRRFSGSARGSFPLKGSNFFTRPEQKTTDAALKADIKLLKEQHGMLVETMAGFNASRLGSKPKGSEFTFCDLAIGAAAHDLYHAGQIQLLKRLRNNEA